MNVFVNLHIQKKILLHKRVRKWREKMDKKTTGIVAYLSWIGLLIAFLAGDKKGAKFHLNQSLVLVIVSVAGSVLSVILTFIIPLLGSLVSTVVGVFVFVCMILGIISAVKEEEKELPLIGQIKILK